jgi:hypothetical protein
VVGYLLFCLVIQFFWLFSKLWFCYNYAIFLYLVGGGFRGEFCYWLKTRLQSLPAPESTGFYEYYFYCCFTFWCFFGFTFSLPQGILFLCNSAFSWYVLFGEPRRDFLAIAYYKRKAEFLVQRLTAREIQVSFILVYISCSFFLTSVFILLLLNTPVAHFFFWNVIILVVLLGGKAYSDLFLVLGKACRWYAVREANFLLVARRAFTALFMLALGFTFMGYYPSGTSTPGIVLAFSYVLL